MAPKRTRQVQPPSRQDRFEAEALYAESIFRDAIGDTAASIAAAEQALAICPDYAPVVMTMGSIEYGRRRPAKGRRLFLSLLTFPDQDGDLWEVLDKAGGFLSQLGRYADGLALFDGAVARFPDRTRLLQGISCCAGHLGQHERAVAAARSALAIAPSRPELLNDLGWSLFQAGRLQEAEEVLRNAVALDPDNDLASGNLRACQAKRKRHGEA